MSISMDNYDNSEIPDIQDLPVLNHCFRCGDEIYDGHYACLGICEECDDAQDKEEDNDDNQD